LPTHTSLTRRSPDLPDPAKVVSMQEGNTPIYEAPRCAEYAGLKRLYLKHQGLNPTGSFKDNGMTAGVTQARLMNSKIVACASTRSEEHTSELQSRVD